MWLHIVPWPFSHWRSFAEPVLWSPTPHNLRLLGSYPYPQASSSDNMSPMRPHAYWPRLLADAICSVHYCVLYFRGRWPIPLPKANWGSSAQKGLNVCPQTCLSSIHVGNIWWHFNGGVKSSWSSPLLCSTCFMQLKESFMVYLCWFQEEWLCLLSCVVVPSSLWCPLSF